MLLLLFYFFLVVSVAYGLPAILLWLCFDLSPGQIVLFSGMTGTGLITLSAALDAPAFLKPRKQRKPQRKE